MKDTIEIRAVKIAAKVLVNDGVCRYESVDQCRRLFVTEEVCRKCIRSWLLSKARSELRKEDRA